MSRTSDFGANLAAALDEVKRDEEAKRQAAREAQEAENLQRRLDEETEARAHGIQVRFCENHIEPCFREIQDQIPGGFGQELSEDSVGWKYTFGNATIELSTIHCDDSFLFKVLGTVDDRRVYSEKWTCSVDAFDESIASEWLQVHAVACTKATLAESGYAPQVVRYKRRQDVE